MPRRPSQDGSTLGEVMIIVVLSCLVIWMLIPKQPEDAAHQNSGSPAENVINASHFGESVAIADEPRQPADEMQRYDKDAEQVERWQNGAETPPSDEQLQRWKKDAELGNARAQYNLGVCYGKGLGVFGAGQDPAEAVKWFRKSAEQGHPKAQHSLAIYLYYDHQEVNAYGWLLLAIAGGNGEASRTLESFGGSLSPSERETASLWAKKWKPTHQAQPVTQDKQTSPTVPLSGGSTSDVPKTQRPEGYGPGAIKVLSAEQAGY